MIRYLLAGMMLCCALLPFVANASRGITVQLKASERVNASDAGSVKLYGSSYALVIGIDNYHAGWPRLGKAVEDARAIAKELRSKGFDVTLKTDLDSYALSQEFKKFFAIKGADPDARLLLWYAGHGHTINGEGYLVPADAPPATSPAFKVSALPMRDFGSLVRMANAKHVLSIFDSCFSGTVFQARAGAAPAAITKKTIKPVREFLTSGDAGQQVRDDGSFREYFIRALNGDEHADVNNDGYVTGQELGLFMSQSMSDLTNAAQTPKFGKLQDVHFNQGDYVFQLAQGAVVESVSQSADKASKLRIITRPHSAMVFVDGRQVGPAPLTLTKLKGRVVVSARKAGYADASERIRIRPGKSQKLTLLLDRVIKTGAIRISSNPAGAKWYLDGDYMGTTPDTANDIEPGKYTIKVVQQGLNDWQQSLRVRKGKTSELVATLNKQRLTHSLTIHTTPSDARIRILNIGPKYRPGMQLAPGRYHIEVSRAGFSANKAWIEIGESDVSLNVSLDRRTVQRTASGASSAAIAGIEMVRIPAGSFMMGSPSSEAERDADEQQHRVSIGSFSLGKYEVTFSQYDAFCNATGRDKPSDAGWGRGDRPVMNVSWFDALAYTQWLSKGSGQAFRLPTEAEWEYAARAGSTTAFSTGGCIDANQANYNGGYPMPGCSKGKYRQRTVKVGSFPPNAYGLYDMHGNVGEWTSSKYVKNHDGSELRDSSSDRSNATRSLRGGSWSDYAGDLRAAARLRSTPSFRYDSYGFRVALGQDH